MSAATLTLCALGAAPILTLVWLSRRLRPLAVMLAPFGPLPALALAAWGTDVQVGLPDLFTGVHFGIDDPGRAFLFFTAALWLAAGAYARWYLADDPRRDSFFGLFLVTMSGQLILVLAQDILSFYLGFAVMTFAAYGLIVHSRTDGAREAGRVYIAMAVAGEAMLLSALLLIGGLADSWRMADVASAYAASAHPTLLAVLVITGFGIKAGLVPLHMWLPLAHPVAPTPASALLSGAMIKAGLLGWLRFLPLGEMAFPGAGAVLIGLGVAAAFYGVVTGLSQIDAKTVLAYSSVSQMGYMTVGVGIALAAPYDAHTAILAVAHYAGHHAAAKAALFLAVGVAVATGVAAAGPGRRLLFYLGVALPALALAGAPFTSGGVAKSALKHAGETLADPWAAWLAVLLSIAAVGTALLLARFIVVLHTSMRAVAAEHSPVRGHPGVTVWWVGLVLLSVSAPLWLPWSFPPPAGIAEPFPVLGVFDSLWPVTIGALLAVAVWRYEHRLPLRAGRIPPGDLLIPALRALRRVRRAMLRVDRPLPAPGRYMWRRSAPVLRRFGGALARVDARMASGAPLVFLTFLLLIVLAAAVAVVSS